MSSNRVEYHEVTALALDLTKAPGRVQRKAPKVLDVGANKIKRGMREDASGHGHLSRLPSTVSYDRIGVLAYEIGFEDKRQGELAGIAAFGSVNNAPVLDHTAALRREVPHIMRHLVETGEEATLGRDKE